MKNKIRKILKNLEKEKRVKILFAVENGSRAWRMHSAGSDYDVRFVFKRSLEEYVQINLPREVINAYYDENMNACDSKNAFIDVSGFDVFKYARLLANSNPTTIEWLVTDIVYYGEQNKVFKEFALKNFNKTTLYYHYKSMCRRNYLKYLKSGNQVTYKKYLYAFRGLVNAKWVAHQKTIPPIIFTKALKGMKGTIPENVLNKIRELIKQKMKGEEKTITQSIPAMDEYIESFLEDDSEKPIEKSYATLNELNKELRRIIIHK